MKKAAYLSIAISSFIALTTACGHNTSIKEQISDKLTEGSWVCSIDNSGFKGLESLSFEHDNRLGERSLIRFSSSDSGFEFALDIDISISGNWKLSNDSLQIRYNITSLKIRPNRESFTITTTANDVNGNLLDELKDRMLNDLSTTLTSAITAKYEPLSTEYVLLGRITRICNDTMLIENRGKSLSLTRKP